MASLNQCNFIGNITKDPETKYLSSGDAVTNISIACNETWKGKQGEKQEKVEFVNIVFYRKLAEIVSEYCRKGQQIYVSGKMETKKWQDKSGADRWTTSIIANEMKMLGSKSQEALGQDPGPPDKESKPDNSKAGIGFADMDDDIPF